MSTNLLLTMGQLPEGFCPASWQAAANEIMANAQVQLPEAFGFGLFTFGPNTPTVDQRLYPWFKTNLDGTPDDIYIFVGGQWVGFGFSRPPAQNIFCGRLTLLSGDPLPSTDQVGSTLYLTPYNGNVVTLWNGTKWIVVNFEEVTLSSNAFLADTNYDVWAYWSGTEVLLESTAWTSDTARAIALITTDGVYVKTGDFTRRYVGTVRTTATPGQLSDTVVKRFVYNYPQRETRLMQKYISGSWSYGTPTWRLFNADVTARLDYVVGLPTLMEVKAKNNFPWQAHSTAIAIGVNSVTVPTFESIDAFEVSGFSSNVLRAELQSLRPVGYGYFSGLEYSQAAINSGDVTLLSTVIATTQGCFLRTSINM